MRRPISYTTYALLAIWDGLPPAIWYGIFAWLARYASQYSDFPFEYCWLPLAMFLATVLAFFLRPLRKVILLTVYRDLAKSNTGPLTEMAVWKLLQVAHRFWKNQPVTDFVGLSTLHAVHDQLDWPRQMRLRLIVHHIEDATNSPLTKQAGEFLTQVEDRPWPGSGPR